MFYNSCHLREKMSNDKRKFKKIIDGIEKNGKLIEKLAFLNDQKPVCVGGCKETNVNLYFCSVCDKSYPVCRRHFKTRQRSKICLVCETKGITRRWTMPVHKI